MRAKSGGDGGWVGAACKRAAGQALELAAEEGAEGEGGEGGGMGRKWLLLGTGGLKGRLQAC